jgi:hypothetical protein
LHHARTISSADPGVKFFGWEEQAKDTHVAEACRDAIKAIEKRLPPAAVS